MKSWQFTFPPLRWPAKLLIYTGLVALTVGYLSGRFSRTDTRLVSLSCHTNINRWDILVYVTPEGQLDYGVPIKPAVTDSGFVFNFTHEATRNFRIYLGRACEADTLYLNELTFHYADHSEVLDPNAFSTSGIHTAASDPAGNIRFSNEPNGYFELKKSLVTQTEFLTAAGLSMVLCIPFTFLLVYLYRAFANYYGKLSYRELLPLIFLMGIFLPQKTINSIFIASSTLLIWGFSLKAFRAQKLALLFFGYFIVISAVNFFVSPSFSLRFLETALPFFFIPIYMASIPRKDYLPAFPASAVMFGSWFIVTSIAEFSIYRNPECFSFDHFSKYVHPVYFSYLLLFALFVLEIRPPSFSRRIMLPIILVCMLCCGSKLILALTLIFYLVKLLRRKSTVGLAVVFVVVVSVFLFSPTRKRFISILDQPGVNVERSGPVTGNLNGLSLRLLIWQEAIRTESMKVFFTGRGFDDAARMVLRQRLTARGLDAEHAWYDPHNQFIATYYQMGLAGLFVLLLICYYVYRFSMHRKDELLAWSAVLFSAAMLTESVLQRAAGIYFFVAILTIQFILDSSQHHRSLENSDTGHQGDPQ
jgi:hypothetical protein